MSNDTSVDIPVKPRVLIADDSRIVRATLIKHIAGMFDFREALDGEQAWETLLIDPSIRVVITDLTMPKLDGYGLLQRIRSSKISRIRNIPVVVISGNDEEAERERAKAAGATDLITKGIGTAQLLSRLDILSKLTNTQSELERGLETLVKSAPAVAPLKLDTSETLDAQAETMLASAVQQGKNFVILHACIGMKHKGEEGVTSPPADIVGAIGQMLRRTVRQTDCVAQTGDAEFTLATGNVYFDSARHFAQRVCSAIANADLIKKDGMLFIASCGMISLSEYGEDTTVVTQPLSALRTIAHQRARLGLSHAFSGVVGVEEEATFRVGSAASLAPQAIQESADGADSAAPDLATLLQWVKEGKNDQVLQHIGKLSADLQPLLSLLNQERK